MTRFLYSSLLTFISWFIPLVALFNPKVRSWYQGRRQQQLPKLNDSPIWVHCASLGEFEQGRPVLEALKEKWPDIPIVLTFFSSSGYEVRKNYSMADWVGYLPLDLPVQAKEFITGIHPRLVIFVKYEYWFNYLLELDRNKIPFLFISNVWRSHYFPLKWWATWFLGVIKKARAFFVQDQISYELLKQRQFEPVFLAGDTRIDRVMELIRQPEKLDKLDHWEGGSILVGGSTWPEDEKILYRFYSIYPRLRLILAPHDPSPERLEEVSRLFSAFGPRFYSQWQGEPVSVLIIDRIGLLNRVYAYAEAAYIGGGFDKGIHNTLEAAVYGIPVFFGPRNKNFKEAQDLMEQDLAFEISRSEDLIQKWAEVVPDQLPRIKQQTGVYFIHNQGATAKIIDYLSAFIHT